jgi:hypothetical protein
MKKWNYTVAGRSSYGLMKCAGCGKQITDGQFRYRETDDAFVTQHRACSESDANWARMDEALARNTADARLKMAAFVEFRDRWQTDALDDAIDELRGLVG